MRKIFALLFIVAFASGCATMDYLFTEQKDPAKSVWPEQNHRKWYRYHPEMLSSGEEAAGTLKNLQENFVEFSAGQHFKAFDLDKYGLRTKWEWTETTETTQYVPNSGGYFVGWNYVPYYGGSYQPRTYTNQYRGAFVIPFAEVYLLEVYHYPYLNLPYKWGLAVYLDNKKPLYLRTPDEKTVRQLANAIATLSKEQGRSLRPELYNLAVLPLKPEQSAELALQPGTGLLIYDVAIGSTAEKVGLRFLDVILEVDSKPVKDVNELVALAKNKKSVNLKILRREKITDAAGKISMQKTELFFPLNLDQ
ncbi:MAG: PDZ domain-containing protein [Candidatus Omnitrophica bacterium]|nr:PDZ domain-containing protein [Candidatus Omnitrophota bacterium]